MFTQKDVEIVIKALPHGARMEIYRNTRISRPTINRFFSGKNIRPRKAERIYSLALEIALREKRKGDKFKAQHMKIFDTK